MGVKSSKELGERPIDLPLSLPATADIIALQRVPEFRLGTIEQTGRVRRNCAEKMVVGWVDANGIAFRNDFNKTKVGRVDLATGNIYQTNHSEKLVGRVDANGSIFPASTVVHASATGIALGKIVGPPESYSFAACAFFLLF